MQNRVFRKVSLERLSSPEQLDQVMQVTTPRGWLALGALCLLLLTAIVWGVAGRVGDKVSGRGILVRTGGVLEVVSAAPGRVVDVAVAVGDSVTEGQVVARLVQPELFDRLKQARANLQALREEHRQAVEAAGREARLQARSLDQQRENVEQVIAASEESLRWLGERIESQERLVAEGLMTKPALLSTRQQYEQTRERIRASQGELSQIELRRTTIGNQVDERIRAGELKIEQGEAEVAQLERDFTTSTQVVSPYGGRILEIMTEPGKIVNRGEPVLSLDLTGRAIQDLVAILYVPSVHGKMVKPGMRIQIAPSTVRPEEYGYMIGRVTFVSDYPATPKGMHRVLKNEQLIQELSGGGAPYEVHATLVVDPATASRYRWSSSEGPPTRIESGTLASAIVTVSEQRPIALVLPIFRRWTGF